MASRFPTPDDERLHDQPGPNAMLARIADALGLPRSHFSEAAHDGSRVDEQSTLEAAAVIELVRSYLQVASPDARRAFVEAVTLIADDPTSRGRG